MPEILYRQLQHNDQQQYREIRLHCLKEYPDNFGSTYDEERNAISLKLDKAIKGEDKDSFVFGAFASNNELVGICGFVRQDRLKTAHRGELIQLFVDPTFSGQGIGKKLMGLTIKKAFENNEIEQIILGVVNSNDHAVKIYKQMGFIEYGRLDNYFKSGDKYFSQLFFVLTKK